MGIQRRFVAPSDSDGSGAPVETVRGTSVVIRSTRSLLLALSVFLSSELVSCWRRQSDQNGASVSSVTSTWIVERIDRVVDDLRRPQHDETAESLNTRAKERRIRSDREKTTDRALKPTALRQPGDFRTENANLDKAASATSKNVSCTGS